MTMYSKSPMDAVGKLVEPVQFKETLVSLPDRLRELDRMYTLPLTPQSSDSNSGNVAGSALVTKTRRRLEEMSTAITKEYDPFIMEGGSGVGRRVSIQSHKRRHRTAKVKTSIKEKRRTRHN
jgi:hypothetical protein